MEYKGKRHAISGEEMTSVRAIVDEMLEDGMKVLAVAYRPLKNGALSPEDEHDLILLGYLAFLTRPNQVPPGQSKNYISFMWGYGY